MMEEIWEQFLRCQYATMFWNEVQIAISEHKMTLAFRAKNCLQNIFALVDMIAFRLPSYCFIYPRPAGLATFSVISMTSLQI